MAGNTLDALHEQGQRLDRVEGDLYEVGLIGRLPCCQASLLHTWSGVSCCKTSTVGVLRHTGSCQGAALHRALPCPILPPSCNARTALLLPRSWSEVSCFSAPCCPVSNHLATDLHMPALQIDADVDEAKGILKYMRRCCIFFLCSCCCECDPNAERDKTRRTRVKQ